MEIILLSILSVIAVGLTYISLSKHHENPMSLYMMASIFWIFLGLTTIINVQYYFQNDVSFTIYTITGWAFQYIAGFILGMYGFALLISLAIKTTTNAM